MSKGAQNETLLRTSERDVSRRHRSPWSGHPLPAIGTPEAVEHFLYYVEKTRSCWLWRGAQVSIGYGMTRGTTAHRVAWMIFVGPIPDGMWVLHKCDNPPCVKPKHLFLGDALENRLDCVRKGRDFKGNIPPLNDNSGERNGQAKVTQADVDFIRAYAAEQNYLSLSNANKHVITKMFSDQYGIHVDHVASIIRGRSWRA